MNDELQLFPDEPKATEESNIPTDPDEYAARVAEAARGPQERQPSEAAIDQGWDRKVVGIHNVPGSTEERKKARSGHPSVGGVGNPPVYPADGTLSVLPNPKAHAAMDDETRKIYEAGIAASRQALEGDITNKPE
ncbi:MAG: hypothetical protein NTX11_00585 [Candidatus Saccharibacteria bacterium]|nr:hypothetical protein [Candidatus Saccharibacteria bacterium]